MSRKRLRSAVTARGFSRRLVIVAALVAVLVGIARVSGGASSNQAGAVSHPSAGIARSGSRATAGGSGNATASATSFGPNVGNGIYDGESPAVSDLPVLPVPAPTSITARDNENLHPSAFSSTAAAHNPPPPAQYIGQLPGDLDGSTLPPAGQPNLFAEVDDPSTIPADAGFYMRFWKFHVDWTNPANSTFGINGDPNYKLPVAAFVRPQCVYGYGPNCVVQKGGPQWLDVLGDRLMFRMPIRNYGRYESVALNHTVVANGTDGIRWYEVRIPKGGNPSVYQQGTYAPTDSATNPLYRWMGSVAMDKAGDLAVGYSASGPNDYPSVRYTGRTAADPLGQLAQAEKVAFTGTGPQTEVEGRWGDYSDLTVDPTNDCTFFYTTEYLADDVVVIGTWRTRVVSFRFPGCK